MNGNTVVDTVTLTADNNWTATVQNLPKKANGTDITYTWSEGSMPEGYSLTDTSVNGKVTTLTNTYAPEETSVSVRKVWADNDNQDGIRTAGITVQLYADGTEQGEAVVLNEANNWSHTWTKLAKNANKTAINYTVDEVSVPAGLHQDCDSKRRQDRIHDHQHPYNGDNRGNRQKSMERQQ